ncbi:MAG: ABC transporter permease subunit [Lawsonibacter sp.]|nr:ABC transporter permease subunit [Lawsonibacter sp.]
MTTFTISPKGLTRALLALAFWLGVWQLGAAAADVWMEGRGNELMLPYPSSVFRVLLALAGTGEFWMSVLASLRRVLAGLALGTGLGLALAALTCVSPLADCLFSPAVRVVRAAPVASFILLVQLWARRSEVPAVISALMVLPVVWGGVSQGIRETDGQLLELARAYRFSRWKTVRLIYLPSVRPYLLSSVTTAMGLAWKSGVAAEVLCLPRTSIGTRIYYTKYNLEVPELFAWTLAVVALSLLLEGLLARGLKRRSRGGAA